MAVGSGCPIWPVATMSKCGCALETPCWRSLILCGIGPDGFLLWFKVLCNPDQFSSVGPDGAQQQLLIIKKSLRELHQYL
jgi:hypothetical protein